MQAVLETERLLLRPLSEDDIDWLFEMDTDPEVMHYITGFRPESAEASRAWIQKLKTLYHDTGSRYGFWAVVEKVTGEPCGWLTVRPAMDYRFANEVAFQPGQLELGYRFRRRFWGQGYCTEGSHALVDYAFADPAIEAIVAVALVENRASTRIMEKLGMKRIGEYPLPGYDIPAVKYWLGHSK
jgi:[ribosomal protein S5]-alanine N-acetyltransferase